MPGSVLIVLTAYAFFGSAVLVHSVLPYVSRHAYLIRTFKMFILKSQGIKRKRTHYSTLDAGRSRVFFSVVPLPLFIRRREGFQAFFSLSLASALFIIERQRLTSACIQHLLPKCLGNPSHTPLLVGKQAGGGPLSFAKKGRPKVCGELDTMPSAGFQLCCPWNAGHLEKALWL